MEKARKRLFTTTFLVAGIALLIFTFAAAFVFLILGAGIPTSHSLSEALGEILGPIAEALIKVLFLGVMGWIGSILTIRGIQMTSQTRPDETSQDKQ
jgi:hypothetical protein